eukprot:jgi/Tetstr1/456233/TSEL_042996.t1
MGTPNSELSTDWQRSAGNFTCLASRAKRLPAERFSKAQLAKAQKHPDLAATCKTCTQAAEAAKQSPSGGDGAAAAAEAGVKHACAGCKEELPATAFTKSQLTQKGPGKQRCKECVQRADAAEAEAAGARRAAAGAAAPTGVVGSLVAACQESSQQAKAVTGARIRHTGGSRAAHMRKVEAAKARREAAGKS